MAAAAGPQRPPGCGRRALPDFSGIATRAVSGVVNISSLQEVRTPNSPFASDPFFRYFFGDDEELFGSRSRRSLSLGSGVIVSPDGYIVTNNHVVGENVREISAVPARQARGARQDRRHRSDDRHRGAEDQPRPACRSCRGATPSKLKIGQWVLAIGSPFQLNQTVTLGIVSAVGRANVGVADYEDFIQTDAAINPGNSGGALIDARGELVGINTAIYSQSGGYQGVGFAVPSNLARRVVDELVKYGEVRRGSIGGLEVSTADHAARRATRRRRNAGGAVVTRMARSSAAYEAGSGPAT